MRPRREQDTHMAESLFDNRYRYDYIYPRGRSGETLRAEDTQANNRPVVIKRPGANDAPPIRAGQEVSIVNERRALQRLAGHPVLTELLAEGQFFVGGMAHQYIVMERAEGLIIGDRVSELNAMGERLPELEMLVIIDQLLDLLNVAHARDIIYNDVDAKHLFWKREEHQLKIIDWGNAVFLEGDEVTQQGISRQTDIYQVGELLYYILCGGARPEVPRNAAVTWQVNFYENERRVHSELQNIVSKALHPKLNLRYGSIGELRRDLAKYRHPLEQQRNDSVQIVVEKLKQGNLSKNELRTLRSQVEGPLSIDPGHPTTLTIYNSIVDQLRDLSVEADLDAARLYMENGNWTGASEILGGLRDKAGTQTGALIRLLLDICVIMLDNDIETASAAIQSAITTLFDQQAAAAAKVLLQPASDEPTRRLQWQVAERISSHVPEVLLLRPNLYRLNTALSNITVDGTSFEEARIILQQVDKTLDEIAQSSTDLPALRDSYRAVVDQLQAVNPLLQTVSVQHQLPNHRLPLSSLDRALNAAMALADSMHVVGKQAASNPREALQALEISRSIDPTSSIWDDLEDLLNRLYERLQSCQTYVPAADGGDLANWVQTTRDQLLPFKAKLYDPMLDDMLEGLDAALREWRNYQRVVLQGNRERATKALEDASEAVQIISPTLNAWFRQLYSVVNGANYVERHALPGGLGRALADGWQAFDLGRLSDAERLGQQAYEAARTDYGQFAASRLQDLARLTRDWIERTGVNNPQHTSELLGKLEDLFTNSEQDALQRFERQMPSNDTYLKAMSKGIVQTYERGSTAALRILFVYYVLQGTLDANEGHLDDGAFWHEAAVQTLEKTGRRHVATRTLDEYIIRQREITKAGAIFQKLVDNSVLEELVESRRQLENSPQARLMTAGVRSLRELELALNAWRDGDFRAAGLQLEAAVEALDELEKTTRLDVSECRAWLMRLMQGAADLNLQSREMRQIVDQRSPEPDPAIAQALDQIVDTTTDLLGENYATTLRQWRDTYQNFTRIYTASAPRKQRLDDLNAVFRALFIDQHPAYPLYRHWYALLEAQDDEPEVEEAVVVEQEDTATPINIASAANEPISANGLPLRPLLIVGGVVLIAALAFGLLSNGDSDANLTPTAPSTSVASGVNSVADSTSEIDVTEDIDATEDMEATGETTVTSVATDEAEDLQSVAASEETEPTDLTNTPETTQDETTTPSSTPNDRTIIIDSPTNTTAPTTTPITPTPTPSDTPTATQTPTATDTATVTPTPSPTLQPTLPPNGLIGRQDLLQVFRASTILPFNDQIFIEEESGYRLGIPEQTDDEVIRITPPQDFLEAAFGNDAATRIRSVEATITLRVANPTVLDAEDATAFFGLQLESATSGDNIGVRIDVADSVETNIINVSSIRNNNLEFLRQRSVNFLSVRLRLERDPSTGNVTIFINGEALTEAEPFIDPSLPVLPTIFVKDGGVLVEVSDWQINLR